MTPKINHKLSKFRNDRRGTAEIVGSVMFIIILLFAFTNIYLWHDSATREMNGLHAEKLNTPVSISVEEGTLVVTNKGGFEVRLSRLWLINSIENEHYYVDLEHNSTGQPFELRVPIAETVTLEFTGTQIELKNGSVLAEIDANNVTVHFPVSQLDKCKILTSLGNMAACKYEP